MKNLCLIKNHEKDFAASVYLSMRTGMSTVNVKVMQLLLA
jgi:hypothetical protein